MMRSRNTVKNLTIALLVAIQCVTGVAAQPTPESVNGPVDVIRRTMAERFPDGAIGEIRSSPWPGLFELTTDTGVAYTNSDASLLFVGRIVDTSTKTDLTQQRVRELQSVDFEKLPFDLSIKVVKGAGSRRVAVFADPECPFCRRLEQTLQSMDDIAVYTFLVPIAELHPAAPELARDIYCAKDPVVAWTEWMHERKAPAKSQPECDGNALSRLLELGSSLRMEGTPTMFFADGHRATGAMDEQAMVQHFSEASIGVVKTPDATRP
jgi:thiol:disulfide interchange protein DsbC